MFNGIVETTGKVDQLISMNDCLILRISSELIFEDLKIGDSVAVNGVCLTITEIANFQFTVTVVPETLRKSNLAELTSGSSVNLERSMQANDRIHGHFVQGHVDGVGEIISITSDGEKAWLLTINVPVSLKKYLVNKGYVAIDGMSLTIIEAGIDWISLTLIPHTKLITIAKQYSVGSLVNIEVDIIGKFIENLLKENTYAS